MRIALLTDLNERIAPDSVADEAVLAFEIAESLADSAREVGGFALDLVARRGSWRGLPLISLELDDLPHSRDKSLDGFVRQEAAYCELILAGLLQDYHLVHCLAPIVTPLQLLSSMGTAIVQTLLVGDKHPASSLPVVLLRNRTFQRTVLTPSRAGSDAARVVVPSVDLEKFYPLERDRADYVLWLETADRKAKRAAAAIAARMDLPLRRVERENQTGLLQGAAVFLYFAEATTPASMVWPLRAAACGKPVAAWRSRDFEDLFVQPGMCALAPTGNWELLAQEIQKLPSFSAASQIRRQTVVARHNRRAMTARYREVYSDLLGGP